MEKRYVVAVGDDHEDGDDGVIRDVRRCRLAMDGAHAPQVGHYRSSTSAGAIAGRRSALALSRRGSFTHSTRHP
jgi:hypothetical protein